MAFVRAFFRAPGTPVPLHGHTSAGEAERADHVPVSTAFDPAARRLVQTFRWGEIERTWRAAPGRIDCAITVRNRTDRDLSALDLDVLRLRLPAARGGWPSRRATSAPPTGTASAEALSEPVVLPLAFAGRALVACSPEAARPLQLLWIRPKTSPRPAPAEGRHADPNAEALAEHARGLSADIEPAPGDPWRILLRAGGDRLVYHDRYTTRPVPPGGADTYVVSLRVADPAAPMAAVPDIGRAYAAAHPMRLDWPDRRPIFRAFHGDKFPYHPPEGHGEEAAGGCRTHARDSASGSWPWRAGWSRRCAPPARRA